MSRRSIFKKTSPPLYEKDECICLNEENEGKNGYCDDKSHKLPTSINAKIVILLRQFSRKACTAFILVFCTLIVIIVVKSPFNGSNNQSNDISQPRIIVINNLNDFSTLIFHKHLNHTLSSRKIDIEEPALAAQKRLQNSKKYNDWSRDSLWEETSFPSCNKMHEIHMEAQMKFIDSGGYNNVFLLQDYDYSEYILKILDGRHTDRNFDRVRRDSLIMERSTRSSYIVNMYSFCGFAQIVEFGKDGGLEDVIWQDRFTSTQRLQVATQVAQALADVHNIDGDGISSMTHGDFAGKQYILINGVFKLNDFNRGRFLRWNPNINKTCPYTIGHNDGKFRAPEEYKYIPETAAIDVWALGSIFVKILTGHGVWHGLDEETAQKYIIDGKTPPLLKEKKSKSPITRILLRAIDMCYVYEPKDRPKAEVIVDFLKKEAKKLGVDWEAPFQFKLT